MGPLTGTYLYGDNQCESQKLEECSRRNGLGVNWYEVGWNEPTRAVSTAIINLGKLLTAAQSSRIHTDVEQGTATR